MCAAVAIVTSSKTPQPTHCAMLRTVGRYDSRAPNSPRSSTMAGGARPGARQPGQRHRQRTEQGPDRSLCPMPAARGELRGACAVRLQHEDGDGKSEKGCTPRLPHSPNWSSRVSACGTGSASVRATSECRLPGTVTKGSLISWVVVMGAATPASRRRDYPDRFRRSVARGATLSARSARAPVRVQFTRMLPAA